MEEANDQSRSPEARPLWQAQHYNYDDEDWRDVGPPRFDRLETIYNARKSVAWDRLRAVPVEDTRPTETPTKLDTNDVTWTAITVVDIAIVGAGPAGLQAAVEAGIDGFNTALIEADRSVGGHRKFFTTLGPDVFEQSGREFALIELEKLASLGVKPYLGTQAISLAYDAQTGIKTITLSDGAQIQALSVVIATGKSFREMRFSGSDSRSVSYANGEKLSEEGRDKFVVVVGGSTGAGYATLAAAHTAKHVYLLSSAPISRAFNTDREETMYRMVEDMLWVSENITVIEGDEVGSLHLDEGGNAVSLFTKGGVEIPCNELGIFTGSTPNSEWLPPEIERINGRVVVRRGLETSIPGVFAAGDVRDGILSTVLQVFADGSRAQSHAVHYIAALMARNRKPYFEEWGERRVRLHRNPDGSGEAPSREVRVNSSIPNPIK